MVLRFGKHRRIMFEAAFFIQMNSGFAFFVSKQIESFGCHRSSPFYEGVEQKLTRFQSSQVRSHTHFGQFELAGARPFKRSGTNNPPALNLNK